MRHSHDLSIKNKNESNNSYIERFFKDLSFGLIGILAFLVLIVSAFFTYLVVPEFESKHEATEAAYQQAKKTLTTENNLRKDLEKNLADERRQYENLANTVSDLPEILNDNKTLTQNNQFLNQQIEQMESELAGLRASVAQSNEQLANTQKRIGELQRNADSYAQQLDDVQTTNQHLEEDLESQEKQMGEQVQKYMTLSKEYEKLANKSDAISEAQIKKINAVNAQELHPLTPTDLGKPEARKIVFDAILKAAGIEESELTATSSAVANNKTEQVYAKEQERLIALTEQEREKNRAAEAEQALSEQQVALINGVLVEFDKEQIQKHFDSRNYWRIRQDILETSTSKLITKAGIEKPTSKATITAREKVNEELKKIETKLEAEKKVVSSQKRKIMAARENFLIDGTTVKSIDEFVATILSHAELKNETLLPEVQTFLQETAQALHQESKAIYEKHRQARVREQEDKILWTFPEDIGDISLEQPGAEERIKIKILRYINLDSSELEPEAKEALQKRVKDIYTILERKSQRPGAEVMLDGGMIGRDGNGNSAGAPPRGKITSQQGDVGGGRIEWVIKAVVESSREKRGIITISGRSIEKSFHFSFSTAQELHEGLEKIKAALKREISLFVIEERKNKDKVELEIRAISSGSLLPQVVIPELKALFEETVAPRFAENSDTVKFKWLGWDIDKKQNDSQSR